MRFDTDLLLGARSRVLGLLPAVTAIGHDPNMSLRLLCLIFWQVLGRSY
jgi:hypothetical protein